MKIQLSTTLQDTENKDNIEVQILVDVSKHDTVLINIDGKTFKLTDIERIIDCADKLVNLSTEFKEEYSEEVSDLKYFDIDFFNQQGEHNKVTLLAKDPAQAVVSFYGSAHAELHPNSTIVSVMLKKY
ncbi:hypothetical protein RaK2_00284 [Klebsiella phage vB_KleM_RaK2]|uniref:Uncharacterized protein n=1 Tax=Klebsiella phage vB_KleM_RaK2 TaxID=1147094 RepID=H6X491_9CAUD|nr:hypothetical protein F403_gp251 [Klebsiella phage vB_KleM_RaK2]AFA44557.1 hypothetical protein RaK2_00284 [Klebsiella phage vB_KleM_RaK2]QOE32697.1 hypothetical protein CPT_Muenster_531 [Klebsiella phage Muenster]